MNFLERIPTRWLLAGAALACLALWAAPSSAQMAGDPVAGKRLYDDTANESGNSQLTGSCSGGCHGDVDNRRTLIGGSAYGDILVETAYERILRGVTTRSAMRQFEPPDGLTDDQIIDIAAYIADTPKVTSAELVATAGSNTLAFVSTAVGNAVTKSLTIKHSTATTTNLTINSVSLAAGTTAFTRTSGCNNVTRGPAATCTFSVTYTPTGTATENKDLTVTMHIGSAVVTRVVRLNGSIAGTTPTPTPPPTTTPPATSSGGDSGGGALGWAWLSGLALATAVLARRRRNG